MTFQQLCGLPFLMTALSLAGCGTLQGKCGGVAPDSGTTSSSSATTPVEPGIGQAAARDGLGVEGDADDSVAARAAAVRAEKAGLAAVERMVHFDFDSAELNAAGRARLDRHAAFMTADSGVRARLEGHADEHHCTPEYNVALGERRARAVARYLQTRGVAADRLDLISYGDTRPMAEGRDEAARPNNRRVDISYR